MAAIGSKALYVLALNTGMRQGELLALKWDDVDLEGGRLRVRHTLTQRTNPTSSASRRPRRAGAPSGSPPDAVTALKATSPASSRRWSGWGPSTNRAGSSSPRSWDHHQPLEPPKPLLQATTEARRLRQIRFHDLRHTCATLLSRKNVNPKVVSEMLGHASISITLDIYSHLLPDMQEKAARALEDALS